MYLLHSDQSLLIHAFNNCNVYVIAVCILLAHKNCDIPLAIYASSEITCPFTVFLNNRRYFVRQGIRNKIIRYWAGLNPMGQIRRPGMNRAARFLGVIGRLLSRCSAIILRIIGPYEVKIGHCLLFRSGGCRFYTGTSSQD